MGAPTPGTTHITELRANGDRVLAGFEAEQHGAASGVKFQHVWWQVFTVRGDRLCRVQFFGSRDQALGAAGLTP